MTTKPDVDNVVKAIERNTEALTNIANVIKAMDGTLIKIAKAVTPPKP